jgi:periplasmic divalent cation tolerance protein
MENPYILVMVTASSKQEAEKIAQQLLEEKLIACVNIVGPVFSHFHWAGKIDHAEEYLMLMKSRVDLFDALAAKVRAFHSYEVPEVIALPVLKGSAAYLNWLDSVLK